MKNSRLIGLLLSAVAIALLTVAVHAHQANDPEVQLRAAIQKEEVDGNLQAAITLYKQIAKSKNRAAAAQALLRLGGCYEKQGNAEARKTFERLLTEFKDQTDVVSQARMRLAALASDSRQTTGPGATIKQIELPDRVGIQNISWDGRYLLCSAQAGLMVRDLVTGTSRQITDNSKGYVGNTALAPDGKFVFYTIDVGTHIELRAVNLAELSSRLLYSHPPYASIWSIITSPDGRYVFAVAVGADRHSDVIIRIAVADGVIKNYATGCLGTPAVSPDGRYLACLEYHRDPAERSLKILDTSTGNVTPLPESKGASQLLGWSPSGALLFTMRRAAAMGISQLRIVNGRPQGAAELVRPDIGVITPIGISRSGSFFYYTRTGATEIYVVTMDATGLSPEAEPTRLDLGSFRLRYDVKPTWSPD